MTQADSVHSTPPTNTSAINDSLDQAIDAFSASPALRLRFLFLNARRTGSQSEPVLPPPTEHLDEHQRWPRFDAAAYADQEGHPLAKLIRLRQEAADEIERLLAFLDASEGDFDLEARDEPTDAEIRSAGFDGHDSSDDDELGGDDEPCLGRPEFNFATRQNEPGDRYCLSYSDDGDQTRSQGGSDDREGPDDDLEPSLCGVRADCFWVDGTDMEDDDDLHDDDVEREPSLGWTPHEAARGSYYGGIGGVRGVDRVDLEEDAGSESESDPAESGIADFDGLMEQCPGFFAHCDVRVIA